jgi:hypothetical protein
MSYYADLQTMVDLFLLEVGEGRMPRPDSEEAQAYEAWRAEEVPATAVDRTSRVVMLSTRKVYVGLHRVAE